MHRLFAQHQAWLHRQAQQRLIKQPVLAFHPHRSKPHSLEQAQHWLAELACGHHLTLCHQPPYHHRPWLVSPVWRAAMLGCLLPCPRCSR